MSKNFIQQLSTSSDPSLHALVVGATGATGKDLIDLLIKDEDFYRIDIFVRRDPAISHPKLKIHIIDFDKPEFWKHLVTGDVLFSALGTTLKAAGSKDAQWKVDFDYQFNFAKAAKENGLKNYVLVSAANASTDSGFFYAKMKGKLEEAVTALKFPKLSIFKPPLLARKNSERTMEVFALKAIKLFNKMGMLLSQKPLDTRILAQAMINAAKTSTAGITIFEGKKIWNCALGEKL